ncbi:MAG: acyl-homoserine-lactone synthase [Pseudomonadota bacterium]
MLYLIQPGEYDLYRQDLDSMYRLRYRVFYESLKWDVSVENGMERDQYDEKNMYYLIYKDDNGIIRGCIRFVEMINDCMFDGPFKFTLPNLDEFKRPGYWELSRYSVDISASEDYKVHMHQKVAKSIMAGLIDFGLTIERVECFLTLTYPSLTKLCKKYGLLTYVVSSAKINQEDIDVWAFQPMSHVYDKIAKSLKINKLSNNANDFNIHTSLHTSLTLP